MEEEMGRHIFQGLLLLCLWQCVGSAASLKPPPIDGICFRFYDQWKVGDQEKTFLKNKYGIICLRFNEKGDVLTEGLSSANKARLVRFYKQCMQDGCLFCDASEGYCETGTCGVNNRDCKPFMLEGRPLCGEECAYYALNQL